MSHKRTNETVSGIIWGMAFVVRQYRSADCAAMAELLFETVHAVNARDYSAEEVDAWADGHVDLAAWDASFLEHDTLVAEEAETGTIIGFADMAADGYLDRLYVHKDHQGEGVATALCDALESRATCQDSARPAAFVTHASITARPFFEHRGYAVVHEQQVVRHGIPLINFVMRKAVE